MRSSGVGMNMPWVGEPTRPQRRIPYRPAAGGLAGRDAIGSAWSGNWTYALAMPAADRAVRTASVNGAIDGRLDVS